jgi:predicted ribosome quality control (RQC) complex YloA/Tae2 family protein
MDVFLLNAVTTELKEDITGAAVRKVFQPNRYDILIRLKGRGPERRLYISTHPNFSRIHLTGHKFANPPSPPRFCLFLRKNLKGRFVQDLDQPPYERTVEVTFRRHGDTDGIFDVKLIAELMGRHSNLIFVDHRGRIQDCINYITEAQSRTRQVLKDIDYQPPPPQLRPSPEEISAPELKQLQQAADSGNPRQAVSIMKGLSPLLAREVLFRISQGLPPAEAIGEISRAYRNCDFHPHIYSLVDEGRQVLSAIPLSMYKYAAASPFESANEAADVFYFERVYQLNISEKKKVIKARIDKEIDKISSRIENRTQDLEGLAEKLKWSDWGEAVKANLHLLHKGVGAADLQLPGGRVVTVNIKPELTPVENMKYLFDGYKKARRGVAVVEQMLSTARARVAFMEENLFWLEEAKDPEEVESVKNDLIEAGVIGKPKPRKKRRGRAKEQPPAGLRTYKTAAGFTVLRGLNSRGNDQLVRMSSAGDLWFHARNIPGSHVVIKRGGHKGDIPQQDIVRAATLAARFSRARQATKVPVDYADIKYVKKPKGSPPGFVTYSKFKTMNANPHAELPLMLEED